MADAVRERDFGLDALRGLAIVAMVASHLAREVLAAPHPMWLRVFSSAAAPLFITLAGLLTAQTSAHKNYPLSHYLHRGGVILLMAALIDMALWGLYPFVGFDVLYLIGVAVPLTAAFTRLRFGWQACLVAGVFLLPSWLRLEFGYPAEVFAVSLSDSPRELGANLPRIVHQWLLSGWFPLLPWLGFSFLGAWLFHGRKSLTVNVASRLRLASALLIAAGGAAVWLDAPEFVERGSYTELFYPAGVAYLLIAAGVVLALFSLAGQSWLRENPPLVQLGRCPLLMYLVHLAILRWALHPLVGEVDLPAYLLIYAALLLILVGLAGAVALSKQNSSRRLPLVLRLLLGS